MFLLLLKFFISFSDLLLSSLTLPSSSTSDLDIDPSAFQSCVVQLQANLKKKREREVLYRPSLSFPSKGQQQLQRGHEALIKLKLPFDLVLYPEHFPPYMVRDNEPGYKANFNPLLA